jgi:hypothetical protein
MPKAIVEGKPTLFFSTNAKDKDWRVKEKFTAIIESCLQDLEDYYTYSPIRIRNIIGEFEEVDVAFSRFEKPEDIFQFVQIRDRNQTEGRPWIQQILGQQKTLGVESSIAVSTKSFSKNAINLSAEFKIKLRLLHYESEDAIRQWFSPMYVGIHRPISRIEKSSLLVDFGSKIVELKVDRNKVSENNILVKIDGKNTFGAISLNRVFDADVIRNKEHSDKLFENIPGDLNFHKATIAIEYINPRLFVKLKNDEIIVSGENSIRPIRGIVFFVYASSKALKAPIKHRFKYLDPVKGAVLAQMIVGEVEIENELNFISIVRHSCDGDWCKIGGAFFR